jgi:hypothetical protein
MPNHTWNRLTITGPAADVEAFRVRVDYRTNPELDKPAKENIEEWLDFNGTVPMPKELKGTTSPPQNDKEKTLQKEYAEKYGAGNWYDWQIKFWGVKWGAYDQSEPEKIEGGLVYEFNTAWTSPSQWVYTTARIFPTLKFDVKYKDEDSNKSEGYKFSFQKAYRMTHQKSYKKFLHDITSPEFNADNKYRDFDKDVLERVKRDDLPLLVNFPWDDTSLYTQRLASKTTTP